MRMFVAAWPDDPTVQRLSSLKLGSDHGLRLVRPKQWHLTLRFLGDVDAGRVPSLIDALAEAAAKQAGPIHCEAGPGTAWFGGERVLQIPVAGLDTAAGDVRSATVPVVPDSGHGPSRFTGHITIARTKRHRPGTPARAAVCGISLSATFDVDHFDLVASQPTPQGHRYTVMGRVPLRG
jgi:RNA 2',3'-cyclic 3'-phosphodiesterase